jgi:NAD+ synthase (glutamine-hydrolysing)
MIPIVIAQMNSSLGAITANLNAILATLKQHSDKKIIIFPELALTGYPLEDFLWQEGLWPQITAALDKICQAVSDTYVIIGHPSKIAGKYYNSASIFYKARQYAVYHKRELPNYGVFDELRYFTPGDAPCPIFCIDEHKFAVAICEDLWHEPCIKEIAAAGVDTVISINASPFSTGKLALREQLLANYPKLNLIYSNLVGGQDELVFDGASFIQYQGNIVARAAFCQTEILSFAYANAAAYQEGVTLVHPQDDVELIYQALVLALKDYVEKNNFTSVLLGLSGGIDSALTLSIACDALGSNKVQAVLLPSQFTAQMSIDDAIAQANSLNVKYSILPITEPYEMLAKALDPAHKAPDDGALKDLTKQNLQARIRGVLLMALSNDTGAMLLCTSNKSETAVGFGTLYGDMTGGFAVLKDVLKTQVYELAQYSNSLSKVIPDRVLTRAPSAELAACQVDADSIPEYAVLDQIISLYMEHNLSQTQIIELGFAVDVVTKTLTLIQRSEYKRRQSPPGPKVSLRSFTKDWRLPVTNSFVHH